MRRQIDRWGAAAFALGLVFCLGSCKKGGPSKPYDAKLPNRTGNMLVMVSLKSIAQNGVTIQIADSKGQTFEGVTDLTGTCSFDFDYAKASTTDPDPVFEIKLLEQGHYAETVYSYTPHDGPNTFVFSNDNPKIEITTSPSAPTSYLLNVNTTLGYVVHYDKGGTGNIPVSIVAEGLPAGWSVNYENQVLGEGVTQSGITFLIPANQYKQPAVTIAGYYKRNPDSSEFASSEPLFIKRGFPIVVWAEFSNGSPYFLGASRYAFHGTWGIGSSNGNNVVWSGECYVGVRGVDDQKYYALSHSFTANTGTMTWQSGTIDCGSFDCGGDLQYVLRFSNPDVGTFSVRFSTGVNAKTAGSWAPTAQSF
jgi:hypothetical protein